ncbi:MAG: tetratricopeptide repeat protein [Nitrospirales bacterium]|nr:tetratricopeptide repeat protein [Nitrospirales bacterium]
MFYGSSNRAVLPVVAAFACAFLLFGALSLADAQTDEATLFTEGYQAYLKGDTDKAVETLNDVLKQYPNGRVNDLSLYWLGKSYQKAGRTPEALAAFRELKTKFPQSSMVGHASRQIAALEKKGPAEQAAPTPEPKVARPPVEPPAELKPEAPPKVAAKPEPVPPVKPEAPPREAIKAPAEQPPAVKSEKPEASPKVAAKPEPKAPAELKPTAKPETAPKVATRKEALKPAPAKPGRVPSSKAPARPPLSAPPAGESVFLVVERVAGLDVADGAGRYVAIAGDSITVPFGVTNRGNAEDAFLLISTLPPSYQAVFFQDPDGSGKVRAGEPSVTETPRLGTGDRARFMLRARLPVEMSDGAAQPFEIKVSSKSDPAVSHTVPTTLVASAPALRGTFALDRVKVKPGDAVSYTLSLSNVGSADARSARVVVSYPGTLRLTQATPSASSVDPQVHTVTWDLARLAPSDRPAVRLDFRVSEDALADQDLGLRAILQSAVGEQTVSVVSSVAKVEAVAGVRVTGAEAFRTVFPRETVLLPFTLRNTGNGADRFVLKSQSDLGGGVTVIEDRNRDGVRQQDEPVVEMTRLLNPQEEIALLAELAVPSDAPDAKRHSIRLAATSERSRSVAAETGRLVVIARPVVAVATQMAAKEGIPGKVFSYQLVATNTGTSPARRVLVSESLPPELEFVDAQPKPGQVEGQRLAWEIADLGSGQQEILTVGVRVKKGIAAGTPVRKSTMVRYRDMKDQVYESSPGRDGP